MVPGTHVCAWLSTHFSRMGVTLMKQFEVQDFSTGLQPVYYHNTYKQVEKAVREIVAKTCASTDSDHKLS